MDNCPFAIPMREKDEWRHDTMNQSGSACFKFDGSAPADQVMKAINFMQKVVGNPDIWANLKIDTNKAARIFAETGAAVKDVISAVYAKTRRVFKAIDIGMLRYPDIDNPTFRVYRFQLYVFADCERIAFHQTDKNGILADFRCRTYGVRQSALDLLPEEKKQAMVAFADSLGF